MIGTALGHYRIDGQLGAGGMGVVYRAFDTRLERTVAIKMLGRRNESPDVIRRRLLHEARSTSALNHPNVCTVYEVGEADDRAYIVMEHIDGETLRSLIPLHGLPAATAIRYAEQVASALAHAHARGVIHRDLKPANVMVTAEGTAKVLDFGLSSRTATPVIEEGTKTHDSLISGGTMAGTLPYMAPEIFRGRPATFFSDVWSMGVLLYELSTGQLPFRGDTEYVVTGAILHSPPEPLPPSVLPSLRVVIERCLEKEPARRYHSAGEVHAVLQSIQAGRQTGPALPTSDAPRGVLVLPFANLASEGDEYFADGLTDEVITDLSGLKELRVISRTSSMRLKHATTPVAELARELNVEYVLEGGVRKSGNQLRVTVKLIDPAHDTLMWSSKYAGTLDDVFTIQESVSRSIVEALRVTLTADESAHLARQPVASVSAYDHYLRAKQEMLRFSKEGLDRAAEYLAGALEAEPDNELLLSMQGLVYWQYVNAGLSTDLSYLEKAQACAEHIARVSPDSIHGHRLSGLVRIHQGDLAGSLRSLKYVLQRDPNDPDTLFWGAIVASLFGRMDLAESWVSHLVAIDPLTPVYQVLPGVMAIMGGHFERAVATLERHLPSNLDNAPARLFHGLALALAGRTRQASKAWIDLERDLPESPFASLGRFYRLGLAGDREAALAVLTPDLIEAFGRDPQYSWLMADGYAIAGAHDLALEWVGKAVANGLLNYALLATVDPFLEPLRTMPEFQALLQDVRARAAQAAS